MLAAPAAQAQDKKDFKGKGGFFGRGISNLMLANQKSVQEDLKMDDTQVEKVKELQKKQFASFKGFKELSKEEQAAKRKEINQANDKAVAEILKSDQNKRLKQISFQLKEKSGRAFTDPEVIAALKISDDQKDKLTAIQKETGTQMKELRNEGTDEAKTKIAELQKSSKAKTLAVLTDDQKKQWKEMTGEPFMGKIAGPGGFGPGKGGKGRRPAVQNRTLAVPALAALERRLVQSR
jgi:hypothetical protein